jgi:nitrate reductase NapE
MAADTCLALRGAATSVLARGLIQINAAPARLHQKWIKATARMPSRFPSHLERPNMSAPDDAMSRVRRKRMEIFAFLILTAVVMPVLAVGTVGSYGLGVWIYQMFAGPPGPPASPH